MSIYKILEIKKEWVEHFSIISVTNLDCVLENTKTCEVKEHTVTFFQLIDLYDAKKDMMFSTNGKIKIYNYGK